MAVRSFPTSECTPNPRIIPSMNVAGCENACFGLERTYAADPHEAGGKHGQGCNHDCDRDFDTDEGSLAALAPSLDVDEAPPVPPVRRRS